LKEIFGTRADGQGMGLFNKYGVCAFSGNVGPKEKEGDMQTPEGFCKLVL
jgi:murein L,D-transpeptidase YafK